MFLLARRAAHRRHTSGIRVCLAFACCVLFAAQGQAASGQAASGPALDSLLPASDLVFLGRVSQIRHRLSDQRGPSDARLPHTFVTYEVERVVHGSYEGSTLTLRFLGGPTGVDGRVVLPQQFPLFALGNRDVLFVRGNGRGVCPLVGCGAGRLRVVDGVVYTDRGQGLLIDPGGSPRPAGWGLGPEEIRMEAPPAPAAYVARERQRLAEAGDLDPESYRRQSERLDRIAAPRVIALRSALDPPQAAVVPPGYRAAELDAFIELLAGVARSSDPGAAGAVADVDFDDPFHLLRPQPVRAPPERTPATRRQSAPPEEEGP